ncbi:DUF547 domain-containing protein [Aquimarina sp. 2201CG14-23]|uniref:DUF547 domain-containing protein n=1 Tax=Aquimarina mycalae TaxID=3040073 RepID=UPI0024782979|nr:DUF547 domain-containing protein [Aquimarina sp. 2201CG14-23]MDH7447968.1 DUF547 domain-containing protein [Aquimarina sp. 2201CG14-23]
MKKYALIIAFFITAVGFSQSATEFFTKSDAFFKKYVSNGRVDYKSIKNDPAALDQLLDIAANVTVSKSKTKTYQAFYINAYNLSVIKGVVSKYPIKSPLDVKGFFDKKTYKLGGKSTTLNDLENKILRKNFPSEARFHFALVCAGLGCPPIIPEAYKPATLDKQLQRQTSIALNNPNFIKVKGKKVQLSQIFEWYNGDFTQNGSEIEYVNKFRKEKIPTNAKVSYYPYNWSLNAVK